MIAWLPWHACLGLSIASAGLVAFMHRDYNARGFVFYEPSADTARQILELLIAHKA